jgi:hypothetical protein
MVARRDSALLMLETFDLLAKEVFPKMRAAL